MLFLRWGGVERNLQVLRGKLWSHLILSGGFQWCLCLGLNLLKWLDPGCLYGAVEEADMAGRNVSSGAVHQRHQNGPAE